MKNTKIFLKEMNNNGKLRRDSQSKSRLGSKDDRN